MAKVIWSEIENYEGMYEISSTGIVRSKNRLVTRTYQNGKVVTQPILGQNIKLTINTYSGYLECNLCKDGQTKTKSVHRLVAQAFLPNPDNKPAVNHKDGNKLNNDVNNLEWVTAKENTAHAIQTGLFAPNIEPLKTFWSNKLNGGE